MKFEDLIGEQGKPVVIEKARVNEFVDLMEGKESTLGPDAGPSSRFRGCAEIVGLSDGKLATHVSRVGTAMFIGFVRGRTWWGLFARPTDGDGVPNGVLADALTNEPKPVE